MTLTYFASLSIGSLSQLTSDGGFTCHLQRLACFDRDNHRPDRLRLMRHPLEVTRGTGILTRFPSTTLFSLALGAD